jgi:hypothetical protein
MAREFRTLFDGKETPLLELVKEGAELVIYEADDMDRQIRFPISVIPALIKYLDDLK